jgi:hypothetical protein
VFSPAGKPIEKVEVRIPARFIKQSPMVRFDSRIA